MQVDLSIPTFHEKVRKKYSTLINFREDNNKDPSYKTKATTCRQS